MSIISLLVAKWWVQLQQQVKSDPFYAEMVQTNHPGQELVYRNGVYYHKNRIYLNPKCTLIPHLLVECHSTSTGGHFGYLKTLARIKRDFTWPELQQMVKKFIKECSIFQQNKYTAMKPDGLLQPLSIPSQVWSEISADFVEGLPSSNGYTVILIGGQVI